MNSKKGILSFVFTGNNVKYEIVKWLHINEDESKKYMELLRKVYVYLINQRLIIRLYEWIVMKMDGNLVIKCGVDDNNNGNIEIDRNEIVKVRKLINNINLFNNRQ